MVVGKSSHSLTVPPHHHTLHTTQAGLFDFAAAGPGGAFNFPNFPVGHPMGLLAGAGGGFREQYRCYSMVFSSKDSTEILHGGKIIMPPSALEKLSRLHISYPMLFKLENSRQRRHTHCGVLEFVAEEGRIYVPHWVGRRERGEGNAGEGGEGCIGVCSGRGEDLMYVPHWVGGGEGGEGGKDLLGYVPYWVGGEGGWMSGGEGREGEKGVEGRGMGGTEG